VSRLALVALGVFDGIGVYWGNASVCNAREIFEEFCGDISEEHVITLRCPLGSTRANIKMLSEARSITLSETNTTDSDLQNLRGFWNIRYLSRGSGARVETEGLIEVRESQSDLPQGPTSLPRAVHQV